MTSLPKCPFPGCAIRWKVGPDRPCADHGTSAEQDGWLPGLGLDSDVTAALLRDREHGDYITTALARQAEAET